MEQIFDWLILPVKPSEPHAVGFNISWHARLMVLAWGVLAPVAIVVARYFKITPGQDWPKELDNPFWWRVHWKGQVAVLVLSGLALALILSADSIPQAAPLHRLLGWLVLIFAVVQALSGYLRGTKGGPTDPAYDGSMAGDHYDMTPRRLFFEAFHKTLGYALLLSAAVCIILGLWAANGPNWMWIVIAGWWACLIAFSVFLQMRCGAYDTYQAIWGPDPAHPGNRIRKQGWGTIRPGDSLKDNDKRSKA